MIGIDDEKFIRGKAPMTKQEIRILSLAKARIGVSDFVVDVGAGTGSLSIEAAKIAERGYVFAIDRDAEAVDIITQNAEKFSIDNSRPVSVSNRWKWLSARATASSKKF